MTTFYRIGLEFGTQSSPVHGRDGLAEGDMLDNYGYSNLSRVMIHEFAHWCGYDDSGILDNRR